MDSDFRIAVSKRDENDKKRKLQVQSWLEREGRSSTSAGSRSRRVVQFPSNVLFLAAASGGDVDFFKEVLELGVDPNTSNCDGLTALHQVSIDNEPKLARVLLNANAEIDPRDNEGWTPLHAAASCGHVQMARLLIANGANIIAVNVDQQTPLDLAQDADEPSIAMIDLLRRKMSEEGVTPLQILEQKNRIFADIRGDAIKAVENGTFDGAVDEYGATLLHVCAAHGIADVADVLLRSGAHPDVSDQDSWTPLHAAVHWNNLEVARLLIEYGADYDAKTGFGETVFNLADSEDENMSRLLKEMPTIKGTRQPKMEPRSSLQSRLSQESISDYAANNRTLRHSSSISRTNSVVKRDVCANDKLKERVELGLAEPEGRRDSLNMSFRRNRHGSLVSQSSIESHTVEDEKRRSRSLTHAALSAVSKELEKSEKSSYRQRVGISPLGSQDKLLPQPPVSEESHAATEPVKKHSQDVHQRKRAHRRRQPTQHVNISMAEILQHASLEEEKEASTNEKATVTNSATEPQKPKRESHHELPPIPVQAAVAKLQRQMGHDREDDKAAAGSLTSSPDPSFAKPQRLSAENLQLRNNNGQQPHPLTSYRDKIKAKFEKSDETSHTDAKGTDCSAAGHQSLSVDRIKEENMKLKQQLASTKSQLQKVIDRWNLFEEDRKASYKVLQSAQEIVEAAESDAEKFVDNLQQEQPLTMLNGQTETTTSGMMEAEDTIKALREQLFATEAKFAKKHRECEDLRKKYLAAAAKT